MRPKRSLAGTSAPSRWTYAPPRLRLSDPRLARRLGAGRPLARELHKTLDDDRLRVLVAYPAQRDGSAPYAEPAFRGVDTHVERTFGVWRSPGGTDDLTRALLARMGERSVDVRFGTDISSLTVSEDRVTGAAASDGEMFAADLVVAAVSPARVFGRLLTGRAARRALRVLERTAAAAPPTTCHLALSTNLAHLPPEVALHGDPLVVMWRGGDPPAGGSAWTVVAHGGGTSHVLDTMAARGFDLRDQVVARLDPSNRGAAPHRAGHPGGEAAYGTTWRGPRTAAARAALARPMAGLHCLGTGRVLGGSIAYVAWEAAHVAEVVGKA